MDVPLLETLKEAITAYTGLSPTTFATVVALALAGFYVAYGMFGGSSDYHPQQSSRSFQEEESQPLPPPVQLGEISEEELKAYDGNDSNKPLLMAIKGQIYDVSQSRYIIILSQFCFYFITIEFHFTDLISVVRFSVPF